MPVDAPIRELATQASGEVKLTPHQPHLIKKPTIARMGTTDVIISPRRYSDSPVYEAVVGSPTQVNTLNKTSSIGRNPTSTITIDDPDVSRRHVDIMTNSEGVLIEDLASTNGTTLKPILEAPTRRVGIRSHEASSPFIIGKQPVAVQVNGKEYDVIKDELDRVFVVTTDGNMSMFKQLPELASGKSELTLSGALTLRRIGDVFIIENLSDIDCKKEKKRTKKERRR